MGWYIYSNSRLTNGIIEKSSSKTASPFRGTLYIAGTAASSTGLPKGTKCGRKKPNVYRGLQAFPYVVGKRLRIANCKSLDMSRVPNLGA